MGSEKKMQEHDYLKHITKLLFLLGIVFFFISEGAGVFFLILAVISHSCWLLGRRLRKIERNIEMLNDSNIRNDERLYNIEQFIKKSDSNKIS